MNLKFITRPSYKYLKFFLKTHLSTGSYLVLSLGSWRDWKMLLVSDLTACYVFNNFKAFENVVLQNAYKETCHIIHHILDNSIFIQHSVIYNSSNNTIQGLTVPFHSAEYSIRPKLFSTECLIGNSAQYRFTY